MDLITNTDVWSRIKNSEKPICMYGMGNGADKILSVFDRLGITVEDFFASDGFVRGHCFHSKQVLSYSDVCQKYGDPLIVLAFGSSLPDMLEKFHVISEEHELLAPDVPVSGGELFDYAFFRSHEKEIDEVYSILEGKRSKDVLKEVIEFKLSGNISFLLSDNAGREDVFSEILSPRNYRMTADLGAYNGDTVRELLSHAPHIEGIFAVEPDKRSYKKLTAYIESNSLENTVIPIFAAAGAADGKGCFSSEGNRNSSLTACGTDTVSVRAVDSFAAGEKLDLIKFDVEGAEAEALAGAIKQISDNRPDLIVSVYHRSQDIFSLPLLIKKMCPEYKIYLRREKYVPAWDVELIATVK